MKKKNIPEVEVKRSIISSPAQVDESQERGKLV
jgi:hypothetical protein